MNTRFEYLYRDASNYKNWGEIVFAGEFDDVLMVRLRNALREKQWFIASQVRIPDLFFIEYPINDDEHCWHEFSQLIGVDAASDDLHERTLIDLVEEIERVSAAGWQEFDRSTEAKHSGLSGEDVSR